MIIPICPRTRCKNRAEASRQYGILPCLSCQKKDLEFAQSDPPEFPTLSQAARISEQRDKHGADIIQPWTPKGKLNKDFVKHYPDKVKDYFSEEQLKKL